ncbi:site-2 protease family protein [Paenibacillus sp. JTLBN-2024]|jgi:Zn-dependent protease|uniref:Zinc metalloprotease YwhC n=1 Tax=Paenibacillus cookii TaxID=157839 RepID=A0ABQ4LS80_9BACL|nr:site-2 protease family protein [Paenibacillus cookii]GIO65611.1 putative zinc metalloprotease YwhC [Paenibacillus cookii]HWO54645.1 site-2 protease family protein [Paenibacillus cookii]
MDFLNKILSVPLEQLPFYLVVLVIAFTVHEFSHAYFANKFGDPTAKLLGRVTLNPAVHFDLLGIILLLIAGFGWARPVPVNRDNFKSPRLMGVVVSAAGPLSNFFLAVIGTFIYSLLISTGVLASISNEKLLEAIMMFFQLFGLMNFFLFLFNLIPLPPLDGYRIVEDLVPRRVRGKLQQVEQWSVFIFLLILFIPVLQRYTISPLYQLARDLYYHFMQVFLHILS